MSAIEQTTRAWLLSERPQSRMQARLGRAYNSWLRFSANRLAVLGLGIAWAAVRIGATMVPVNVIRSREITLDMTVLGFTALLAIVTTMLAGLAPAPVTVFLAGDFNDQPGSRTLELFHARAREAAKSRGSRFTFSSTEPVKEIDFVFAAPSDEWSVGTVEVVDEPMASDHRPVIAELFNVAPAMTTPRDRSGATWDCSGT